MNWDIIEGKWKQATGTIKTKWGKLTDDDLKAIAGKRDQLIGKIQEKYGMAKDQVEKQLADFERDFHDAQASSDRHAQVSR